MKNNVKILKNPFKNNFFNKINKNKEKNKKENQKLIIQENHFKKIFNFDKKTFLIYFLVLGLGIFGCIMVYSASSYVAEYRYGNKFFYLTKQIVGVALGAIAMLIFSRINYEKLKKNIIDIYIWFIVTCSKC